MSDGFFQHIAKYLKLDWLIRETRHDYRPMADTTFPHRINEFLNGLAFPVDGVVLKVGQHVVRMNETNYVLPYECKVSREEEDDALRQIIVTIDLSKIPGFDPSVCPTSKKDVRDPDDEEGFFKWNGLMFVMTNPLSEGVSVECILNHALERLNRELPDGIVNQPPVPDNDSQPDGSVCSELHQPPESADPASVDMTAEAEAAGVDKQYDSVDIKSPEEV